VALSRSEGAGLFLGSISLKIEGTSDLLTTNFCFPHAIVPQVSVPQFLTVKRAPLPLIRAPRTEPACAEEASSNVRSMMAHDVLM
jgi:hypothetical protein